MTPGTTEVDRTVLYLVPSVPHVKTAVRYTHPRIVAESAADSHLVTFGETPPEIADRFDSVTEIGASSLRERVARSRAVVGRVNDDGRDPVLITSFHYGPMLTGYLSDVTWVADVYDDPHQYRLNDPRSHHSLLVYALRWLLSRADRQVYSIHPASPGLVGSDRRFNLYGDGCPTGTLEPTTEPVAEELVGVWAGSPRLDRGMSLLVNALSKIDPDREVQVDVYGAPFSEAKDEAAGTPAADRLTFHGSVEHETMLEAIASAHFGLCVLPERRDWRHSLTIKTREYLAGGTIPVVSNFPGLRLVGGDAAVYVEPDGPSFVDSLEHLASLSPTRISELRDRSRRRAEHIPMQEELPRWFRMALGVEGIGGEFRR